MNKKKRNKNRLNAEKLRRNHMDTTPCSECGEPGAHWVSMPVSLEEIVDARFHGGPEPMHGFWTCAKFYKDGKRIGGEDPMTSPDFMAALGFIALGPASKLSSRSVGDNEQPEQPVGEVPEPPAPAHSVEKIFYDTGFPNEMAYRKEERALENITRFGRSAGPSMLELLMAPNTPKKFHVNFETPPFTLDSMMPEGGFKAGQLAILAGMGRPGEHKSNITFYLWQKALEKMTPEEREVALKAQEEQLRAQAAASGMDYDYEKERMENVWKAYLPHMVQEVKDGVGEAFTGLTTKPPVTTIDSFINPEDKEDKS